jgi:hypothetical protein
VPVAQHGYITIESRWTPSECPACKCQATSHAWLFDGPPPRDPHPDTREAIGEVFMHANSRDCVVHHVEIDPKTIPSALGEFTRAGLRRIILLFGILDRAIRSVTLSSARRLQHSNVGRSLRLRVLYITSVVVLWALSFRPVISEKCDRLAQSFRSITRLNLFSGRLGVVRAIQRSLRSLKYSPRI